jgi:uncharacterized DUF497 family protein
MEGHINLILFRPFTAVSPVSEYGFFFKRKLVFIETNIKNSRKLAIGYLYSFLYPYIMFHSTHSNKIRCPSGVKT